MAFNSLPPVGIRAMINGENQKKNEKKEHEDLTQFD